MSLKVWKFPALKQKEKFSFQLKNQVIQIIQ